jgi:hypothetical protein
LFGLESGASSRGRRRPKSLVPRRKLEKLPLKLPKKLAMGIAERILAKEIGH